MTIYISPFVLWAIAYLSLLTATILLAPHGRPASIRQIAFAGTLMALGVMLSIGFTL